MTTAEQPDQIKARRRGLWAPFEALCREAGQPVDVERYVLGKLEEVFHRFPRVIEPRTRWEDLFWFHDAELTDPGWIMDMEHDLGLELSDEELVPIERHDVAALIALIRRRLPPALQR